MKKIISLLLATIALLSISACVQTGSKFDAKYELEAVLADNTLASTPGKAIKITDVDGSLSTYYNVKQVKNMIKGYYEGKPVTIINGYDTLWESDFVFYFYNGSSYSSYTKYSDEILKYADLTEFEDMGDEYPANQFYFLKNWTPVITDVKEDENTTTVTYKVTVKDDESFNKYFNGYYEDVKPGTNLYFVIELNDEGKITAYSLNGDAEGTKPLWTKFNYEYVSIMDYMILVIDEFDKTYDQQPLVTITLVDAATGKTTAEVKMHKGSPFYAEISADEVLYLDKECTQPYLEYVLAYIAENDVQLAIEKDETYYIATKK